MIKTDNDITNEIANDENTRVKVFDEHNLMSINFSKKVFRKGIWDDITIRARGLFVDQDTGDIRIRSYNKFFNYGEYEETKRANLEKNLEFPCSVFVKENGFLGMMSVINDEIVLATKSSIYGECVDLFKEIWNDVPISQKRTLSTLSAENNCSFVFEVCHVEDKHIIDFKESHIYLLDAVKNEYFNGMNIDGDFSDKILDLVPDSSVLTKKKKVCDINSLDELDYIIKYNNYCKDLEGYVIRDQNGFLFKVKLEYYKTVKSFRNKLNYVKTNYGNIKTNNLSGLEKKFVEYISELPYNSLENLHIIQAYNMFERDCL